jgi:hypothetical protein
MRKIRYFTPIFVPPEFLTQKHAKMGTKKEESPCNLIMEKPSWV